MAERMMAYIREQAPVLREIMLQKDALLADFEKEYRRRPFQRIVAVGSGSSYNAACCAAPLFSEMGQVEMTPCVPTRLRQALLSCRREDTCVLLISQSGASTSTLGVLAGLRENGWRTLALTQAMASAAARECDLSVEIRCGEETVGPKTKGFTATVLTLQLMALSIARIRGRSAETLAAEEKLSSAISRIPGQIERSVRWLDDVSDVLKAAPHILLLGCGDSRNVLLEGALKLLETLYVPCVSYEFEEYLHGVQCTIGAGSILLLVMPDDPRRDRMLKLAEFNEAHGGRSIGLALGRDAGLPRCLTLQGENDFTAVYSVLIPLQVIGAEISARKGFRCDQPKFPTFARELNTKIRQ